MKTALTAILTVVFLFPAPPVQAASKVDGTVARDSYSLGYQIGTDLRLKGREMDAEAMVTGVEDGFSGKTPALDQGEMNRLLTELKKEVVKARRSEKKQAVEGYRGEGRQFLAENAKVQGVTVLSSGLQYTVIREGAGRTPGSTSGVLIHYRGTTLEGQEFYNSRTGDGEPDKVRVDGVVKGLSEALQLMKEGSHWKLFIPADLAYGERGPLADRMVIMEVELLSIVDAP